MGPPPRQALRRRRQVRRATRSSSPTGGQTGSSTTSRSKPEKLDPAVVEMFEAVAGAKGGALIVYGWTMAEDLVKLGKR